MNVIKIDLKVINKNKIKILLFLYAVTALT